MDAYPMGRYSNTFWPCGNTRIQQQRRQRPMDDGTKSMLTMMKVETDLM